MVCNRADIADELDRIVAIFEESSRDVVRLRISMREYDRLSQQLQRYPGSAIIQLWHRSDLLIGCRRLVDTGKDAVSIRRALIRLGNIADAVTAVEIAAARNRLQSNRVHDPADIDRSLSHWIAGHQPGQPLGRPTVQQDLKRISDVADRVHVLATRRVAHRLDKPVDTVTHGEIERLLNYLLAIYVRWSNVLRGVDVHFAEDSAHTTPMVKALELFDWRDYNEAIGEEMRRLGPHAGSWEAAESRVRIEYRFDHDEGGSER